MTFETTAEYSKRGFSPTLPFLRESAIPDTACACIFVNFRSTSYHVLESLEKKLNDIRSDIDVIHIHGNLSKEEKFWLT